MENAYRAGSVFCVGFMGLGISYVWCVEVVKHLVMTEVCR